MVLSHAKHGRTYYEITSTTYKRWLTRQHNKFDAWWNSNQTSSKHADSSSSLKPPFDYIVDRVKREHPGKFKNNLEARIYTRKHDPVGRRYERLRKQGVEPARMYSILKLGPHSKHSKASTGSRGG